jgi:hypothetical protein
MTGRGGRRFSTEAEVLGELERLHFLSLEKVQEYETMAVTAAEAEATHKAMRAKRTLMAKANGVRSISEAELTAEADPDVSQAYLQRLTSAALADSCREAMRSIRTNQEALRTMAASHRPDTRNANP